MIMDGDMEGRCRGLFNALLIIYLKTVEHIIPKSPRSLNRNSILISCLPLSKLNVPSVLSSSTSLAMLGDLLHEASCYVISSVLCLVHAFD
jgi:hypothetical protein